MTTFKPNILNADFTLLLNGRLSMLTPVVPGSAAERWLASETLSYKPHFNGSQIHDDTSVVLLIAQEAVTVGFVIGQMIEVAE